MPNDGRCHLLPAAPNADYLHYYSESEYQDYPSMAHVGQKVRQNKIKVVFATTDNPDVFAAYRDLAAEISGQFASVVQLNTNAKMMTEIIDDQYRTFRSNISLNMNLIRGLERYLDVEFFSKCKDGRRIQRNSCGNFSREDVIEFEAELKLKVCPRDERKRRVLFNISLGKCLSN